MVWPMYRWANEPATMAACASQQHKQHIFNHFESFRIISYNRRKYEIVNKYLYRFETIFFAQYVVRSLFISIVGMPSLHLFSTSRRFICENLSFFFGHFIEIYSRTICIKEKKIHIKWIYIKILIHLEDLASLTSKLRPLFVVYLNVAQKEHTCDIGHCSEY